MARFYTILYSISILVLLNGCVAQHTCSSQDMIGMKEKGFAVDEISNLCTTYKLQEEAVQAVSQVMQMDLAKSPQEEVRETPVAAANAVNTRSVGRWSAQALSCATQAGACRLKQPAERGMACTCSTLFGKIPGVTQ